MKIDIHPERMRAVAGLLDIRDEHLPRGLARKELRPLGTPVVVEIDNIGVKPALAERIILFPVIRDCAEKAVHSLLLFLVDQRDRSIFEIHNCYQPLKETAPEGDPVHQGRIRKLPHLAVNAAEPVP